MLRSYNVEQKFPTPKEVNSSPHPVTDQAIDDAVHRVENLTTDVISEHVAAFEQAHRVLQEHLNEAVDG